MLSLHYAIILTACIVTILLAFNSNTNKKRLLNGIISLIFNAVGAIGTLEIDLIQLTDNSSGNLTNTIITTSDMTLFALHVILFAIAIVFITLGMYANVEPITDVDQA